jgi:hypothetical protein
MTMMQRLDGWVYREDTVYDRALDHLFFGRRGKGWESGDREPRRPVPDSDAGPIAREVEDD